MPADWPDTSKTAPSHVSVHELRTERLWLRQWQTRDRAPFAALNADPAVMQFFPEPLDRVRSDAMAQRCQDLIASRGWGFWAFQERASAAFVGMVGLHIPSADLPFSPCVEVGWRLARPYWGRGLATEAAHAALTFAFGTLELREVLSFTAVPNMPSQAVMRRLGMLRDAQTFEHPALPPGHGLRSHVLSRISRARWHALQAAN